MFLQNDIQIAENITKCIIVKFNNLSNINMDPKGFEPLTSAV